MRSLRPSRRWFQFRLRTLLVASAAVSVAFGWALVGFVQVEERQRLLRTPGIAYDHCIPPLWGAKRVRLIWYLYDAPACDEIAVEDAVDPRTFERIKQLFPEADVHRGPPNNTWHCGATVGAVFTPITGPESRPPRHRGGRRMRRPRRAFS